jgi:hypothetical protein
MNDVVNKKEANELLDSGGEAVLKSLVQQSEMTLRNFPRQRYVRNLMRSLSRRFLLPGLYATDGSVLPCPALHGADLTGNGATLAVLYRVYKRAFSAMEPSVRALRDEIDPELGAEHIEIIKTCETGR